MEKTLCALCSPHSGLLQPMWPNPLETCASDAVMTDGMAGFSLLSSFKKLLFLVQGNDFVWNRCY